MAHYANGKPCDCLMDYNEDPEAYIAAHPTKKEKTGGRWPREMMFNETIDEAKKTRAVIQSRGY